MKTTTWVLFTMAVLAVAAPTASDAKPAATCKSMCQRLTDCKLGSYTKMCLDACKQYGYESTEEGRAQILTFTQYTCKQIASAVGATDTHEHQQAPSRSSAPQRSSPPSSSPRSASPRAPSPANPYDDDNYDDDYDDAPRATAGRSADRGQRSYQAPRGNDAGDTNCSSVCRRLAECNVAPYQKCGPFCSRMASSGHPLRITNPACAELKRTFVTDEWMCWAEGSSGYAYGNGPWTYGAQSAMHNGKTRDDAALAAMKDCNALVGFDSTLSYSSGASTDSGMCKVNRCLPPGTPMGPLL